jgi:hypothetical protein
MQLKLAFLEQETVSDTGPKSPWDQIDPHAQIIALAILARLIAQTLAASPNQGKVDE